VVRDFHFGAVIGDEKRPVTAFYRHFWPSRLLGVKEGNPPLIS